MPVFFNFRLEFGLKNHTMGRHSTSLSPHHSTINRLSMNAILKAYREAFVEMIKEDDPSIINNSSRMHAKVIIQELFRHAEHFVYIQCSNFANDIYGDEETQSIITEALKRGIDVKIAVKNKPQAKEFAEELNRIHEGTLLEQREIFPNDFCVVDDKRFRLERDRVQGSAFVCANDPKTSARLVEIFQPALS